MQQIRLVLKNSSGLHARPAAQFVQTAAKFTSRVTIEAMGKSVDAKSILQILGLGVRQGTEILLTAEGGDEAECIDSLSTLISGLAE